MERLAVVFRRSRRCGFGRSWPRRFVCSWWSGRRLFSDSGGLSLTSAKVQLTPPNDSRWTALRSRSLHLFSSSPSSLCKLGFIRCPNRSFESSASPSESSSTIVNSRELLSLQEVEKILEDVRADDVKVLPIQKQCDWADFMVIATGRSTWHVRNIAQALIYKVKQKQSGASRLILPSMEGQESGKWIVVDSGKVIVHALDEKARAYYNLESLWSSDTPPQKELSEDLAKAFSKVCPKNNSKKRPQPQTSA